MTIFRCAAILFDLDGVLVDSTRAVEREWRLWARQKGVDEEKVIAIAHGVRTLEVIRQVAPHLDVEAEVAEIENREADDQEGVTVMPGAVELVRSIPKGRWGVVTSGPRNLAAVRLQFAGLPVPRVLVTADDVVNGKPHPEPYLKAAELLGVNPAECLVVEDAPAGIRSARAGGMKVVGMASTFQASRLKEADGVVQKLAEIRVGSDGAGMLAVRIG
jgi:mannitol-1-/sugar-/sorbitol-6-phosphatase